MTIETPAFKSFRVTIVEWLSHDIVLQAADEEAAEAIARELWSDSEEIDRFRFRDSGLDEVVVDPCTDRDCICD